jgi:hypothetical protein
MKQKSWRDHAREVIAEVLLEHRDSDEKTIKQALFDAYPFGERAMHPYKIWLDEIQRQRGLKPVPSARTRKARMEKEAHPSLF